jgi:uncharacterized membrane protein
MAPAHKRNPEVTDPGDEKIQGHISEFSNGVFAFAITLLILEVAVPAGTPKANLGSTLISLWPNYLAFLISFFVIGMYWSVYIRLLRELVRTELAIPAFHCGNSIFHQFNQSIPQ